MYEHEQHAPHGGAPRMTQARRRTWMAFGAFAAGATLLLSACTSGTGTAPVSDNSAPAQVSASSPTAPASDPPTTSKAPAPVEFTAAPAAKAGLNPTTPITLAVANGTLRKVSLINPEGKHVSGALSADRRSWHTTEALGYSKTYRLAATAAATDGTATRTYRRAFTTLTPGNMTMPYFNTIYGSALQNGGTYGVAMVPVVNFDEAIANRKAAERALQVTTSPHVDGSWYWVNDHQLHWRPENFYKPGTTVQITAKVYGRELGNGLYGESDKSVRFTIGRKQVTVANDTAPKSVNKVRTFRGGKLIHTMNTSMGEHSGETVNGQYINFYTLDGTYTVLGFENPASMCSDSYGLPANAPGGYKCEDIPWSTKISTDGIYLHELDATEWAQNSGQDVSHGCLNLTGANAQWFYTHSLIGDPVIIHGAKGAPKLQLWQGGDWSVPWSQWQKGSALQNA